MASLRRKYQDRIEVDPRQDAPPVSAPPRAAELPEPAADAGKLPELPETTESPADVAAKNALRERLREMENAETLTRQAQQPPQHAEEPPQEPQQPQMPAHIEKWLAANPRYADPTDQIAQTELYLATLKCTRDGKSWEQPDFTDHIERHLGLRPQPQPNGNGQVESRPTANYAPAPRNEVPPRRPMAAPVSAPPSREPASMATGRPPSRRAPLTAAELEAAQFSGVSPERYAQEKEKMEKLKMAGVIQDGR
jgi:hypothetical protein